MGFNLQLGDALRSESVTAIDDAIRAIARQEIDRTPRTKFCDACAYMHQPEISARCCCVACHGDDVPAWAQRMNTPPSIEKTGESASSGSASGRIPVLNADSPASPASEVKACARCGSPVEIVRWWQNQDRWTWRCTLPECNFTGATYEDAVALANYRRAPAPSPASGESAIEEALHRGYLAQRALDGGGIVKFNEMAERHARALKALASLRAEVERLRTEHARLVAVINDDGSLETIDDIVSIAEDAMHAYNVQNKLIEENVRLRTALAEKEKKQ